MRDENEDEDEMPSGGDFEILTKDLAVSLCSCAVKKSEIDQIIWESSDR
jgi:hypothetical protein